MAKHRAASSRRKPGRAVARGAAVVTAAAVAGVAATTAGSVAAQNVDLAALVIEGSSTNPTGAGIREFYRGNFNGPQDEVTTVNFFTGPFGVYQALVDNRRDNTDTDATNDNVVLSSGWGAANVSLLLTYLAVVGTDDQALTDTLYLLDNNVTRPNGGFGTRYPAFALIGVNPIPTPTSPGAQVIDVGYEYDINGNTPAYVWNGVSMANSLMAYLDRRRNQNDLDLPVTRDALGNVVRPAGCEVSCTVTTNQGDKVRIEVVGDTTFVSYESKNLPLTRPLRRLGEPGIRIANAVDPALRAVVDYGYPYNDPLANPDEYVPARPVPTPQETVRFANDFAAGVKTGLATLDHDSSATTESSRLAPQSAGDAEVTDSPVGKKKRLIPVRHSLDFTPKRPADGSDSARRRGPIRAAFTAIGEFAKRITGEQEADDSGEAADPSGGE